VKAENGFMQKAHKVMPLQFLIDSFSQIFRKYLLHIHLTRVQHAIFKEIKESQPPVNAVIHMDFSQNYSAIGQNDLQSAYFGRNQISIYTVMVYVGQESPIPIVIINDDTSHSKEQVTFYIQLIVNSVREDYPDLAHIDFFTDGCSSQFKNKYILISLLYTVEDLGLTAKWHFFTTSHGKGAVDGLGAVVKRTVANKVLAEGATVYSANDFFTCVNFFKKKIRTFLADQRQVDAMFQPELKMRWEKIKKITLTGSRDLHYFEPNYEKKEIIGAVSSKKDGMKIFKLGKKL
jgi:hypothetical protein